MDDWLSYASKTTGFDEDKIKKLLKEKFQTFSIHKAPIMMMFLMDVRDKEFVEERLEAAQPPPVPACPICGEEAIADPRWDGRFTKKPGWRCKKGGLDHFLKAKANEICRIQGLPILFEEVKDGHENEDQGDTITTPEPSAEAN
jgi:hypothetical protein